MGLVIPKFPSSIWMSSGDMKGRQGRIGGIVEVRKMKKRGIPGEVYLAVFKRDNFTCQYCGFMGNTFEKWAFLQMDHFIPKSKGGRDDPENLVTSCFVCNFMKGGRRFKDIEEARQQIKIWWDQMRFYYENKVKTL
jgi:hypothetical protein